MKGHGSEFTQAREHTFCEANQPATNPPDGANRNQPVGRLREEKFAGLG